MGKPASARPRSLPAAVRWVGALATLGLLTAAVLLMPYQLYAVRTGSMEPTFGPRDLVIVREGATQIGQPVTFSHNGDIVTHRALSADAQGALTTQGDANETPDPWAVPQADVIGGVATVVPGVGYWLVYFKTLPGLGSLFFTGVALCLLWPIAQDLDTLHSGPAPAPPVPAV
jgi:signal peptidase I